MSSGTGRILQLFRERLSEKVHATIPKGIVDGFAFTQRQVLQGNLKEYHAGEPMDVCLRVLKQFRQLQCQQQCIDHIPLITFRDCRVHIFSDNLSRNSCRIQPVPDDMFRANSLKDVT